MAAFADGSAGAVISFVRLTRQSLRPGEALATAVKRSKIPTSSNPVSPTPVMQKIPAPVRRRFCWLKMFLRGMMKKDRNRTSAGWGIRQEEEQAGIHMYQSGFWRNKMTGRSTE
ncbi:MAG: hypothetical protein K5760_06530 [Clostridium sp.]|nr:hypothetical protein [Clostridium sp.]